MAVKGGIKGYKDLVKQLEGLKSAPQKVIESTLSDVKARGPGWIASGITDRYGIKKTDITGGKVGKLKIQYKGSMALRLKYSGRRLTPARFSMSPKSPKPNRGSYTLKATILKGNRKTIGKVKKLTKKQLTNIGRNFQHQGTRNSPQSPWMLQTTGNKKEGGIDYIPFQRRKQPGEFKDVMRTVSLPQMVTQGKDGDLQPEVEARFMEGLEKRMDHYAKRYMGE